MNAEDLEGSVGMASHDLAISADVKWIGEAPHQNVERAAPTLPPTEDPF